ncbi:alphaherpesvirus glycoprotein E domain protein [Ceratobasidium sp. AG-Ba]|nr:alphaherpesvirus glycoprotein E domain protein [Ceratobasidium sp. AG-Ba]
MARLAQALSALGLLSAARTAAAFSFVFTAPVQCGDLTVTWGGGIAPFSLMITPLYSTPQNITIPDSAYNGTHGSYTTTLRVTGKQTQRRFLLTMSDSTGFGSGGTSGLLTAGIDDNSQSCNTTDPGTDFTYDLPSALQQCQPYTWSNYYAATLPLTIYGLIPLGKAFVLSPPSQDRSFTWTANVASGTNLVFVVVDSQGRQGGSSDFYTVSASNDASCIDANSPGSTAQSTAAATSTASTTPISSGTTNNAAVVGASIAGGAVFLIALASLVWFILQRKQRRRGDEEDESSVQAITKKRRGRSVDLLPEERSGHSGQYPPPSPLTGDPLQTQERDAQGRSVYDPDPYVLPPPSEHEGYFPHTNDHRDGAASNAPGSVRHGRALSVGTTMTGGMTKAQMAASGSSRPQGAQRFILHTDAGEVEDDEVVELPPMYTQVLPRRAVIPNAGPSSAGGAADESHAVNDPLRS